MSSEREGTKEEVKDELHEVQDSEQGEIEEG
jgi:hypothetical protein